MDDHLEDFYELGISGDIGMLIIQIKQFNLSSDDERLKLVLQGACLSGNFDIYAYLTNFGTKCELILLMLLKVVKSI